MAFVKWDDRELKRFERDLKRFRAKAVPFAVRDTLNSAAFATRIEGQRILGEKLILRNQRTARGVQVQTERGLRMRSMAALVGGVLKYLEKVEFGGTRIAAGKHGVPIVTTVATGEGRGVQPRRGVAQPRESMRNIRLRGRTKGKTRRQANLIAVTQAIRSRTPHVFMNLGRVKGVFRVTGGEEGAVEIEMVVDLSRPSVPIPANPWLKPAIEVVRPRMPGIYRKQLKRQLVRWRLFKR